MNCGITFHDKALAYLFRFTGVRDDLKYGAPFEITQDGIAVKLGISRSHVSIIVGKMVDKGEATVGSSTIMNSNSNHRRRYYVLTNVGKDHYRQR